MLGIFAYFQRLAINDQHFLLLTFSSYIFLAIGTALLFSASAENQPQRRRIFVNIIILISIAVVLLGAFSLASVPRGGIFHNRRVPLTDFMITLKKGSWVEGERVCYGYSGSAYPQPIIFEADYPVGWVDAFPTWDCSIRVSFDEPVNMNGSIYTRLDFIAAPTPSEWLGFSHGTQIQPIAIVDGTSNTIRIRNFFSWGSVAESSWTAMGGAHMQRARVEGYRLELSVMLYFEEKADYGPKINCTVHPSYDGRFIVRDYVVDSQLQNTAAILLCGVFAGILCFIPAKTIKPKIDSKIAPIISSIETFSAQLVPKQREPPKTFLKQCIECGREIPIASEECPYCGAKQP